MNRPVLLLLVSALLWSAGGLLIKAVEWNALGIAGMRSAIAALTIYALTPVKPVRFSRAQLFTAFIYAATVILFVAANRLTTAANAIFLQYTSPIYIALFGAIFLAEHPSRLDWVLIGLAQAGILLFFFDRLTLEGWWGNLLALASGISYATLTILLRKQSTLSPLHSVLLGNVVTSLVCVPFMFQSWPDSKSWLGLLLLGVFQLGLPHFFYALAIPRVNALEAVLVCMIEPVLNPLWVLIFLGEHPQRWALVGGGLVLAAAATRGILTARRLSTRVASNGLQTQTR